jgi:hypothetical protein
MAKLGAVPVASNVATSDDKLSALWSQLETSVDFNLDVSRLGIVGPPGQGKTTATISLSEYAPATLPAKERIVLKDMFYVVADKGGMDTIKAFGLDAPKLDISSTDPIKDNLPAILDKVVTAAEAAVKVGGVKYVVVDTVSAIDSLISVYAKAHFDKYGIFDFILAEHTKLLHRLSSLPATTCFLFHGKVIAGDALNADGKEKLDRTKKATMGSVADVEIEITGQSRGLYRKHISLLLPIFKTQIDKRTAEYNFYPRGAFSFEGKTRFWMLDDKEPANLKQLIEKIQSAQPK